MANYNTSTRTIRITSNEEVEIISRSTPHTVIDTYDLNAENVMFSKGAGDTFDIVGTVDDGAEALGEEEIDGNEVTIDTSNVILNMDGNDVDLAEADVYIVLNETTLEFSKNDI